MRSLLEELDRAAQASWHKEWSNPAWKTYVLHGRKQDLARIPRFSKYGWAPKEMILALPEPAKLDEPSRRFLEALVAANAPGGVGEWIGRWAAEDDAAGTRLRAACEVARRVGCAGVTLGEQLLRHVRSPETPVPGAPPSLRDRLLLELTDAEAEALLEAVPYFAFPLTDAFVCHAPERWKKILRSLLGQEKVAATPAAPWLRALERAPREFLELAARAFPRLKHWEYQFKLGTKLFEVAGERFGPDMDALAASRLPVHREGEAGGRFDADSAMATLWLLQHRGRASVPRIQGAFSVPMAEKDHARDYERTHKIQVLEFAVKNLGRDAIPLLEACFAIDQGDLQVEALKLWAGLRRPEDGEALAARLRQVLAARDVAAVARAARLAAELFPEAVETELWELLDHKSRPVRDAAAGTLARLGDTRLGRAKALWEARRADTRLAAVTWLRSLGTPGAVAELRRRLDDESDDDVRDAVLLALERIEGPARGPDAGQWQERMKKTLAKVGPLRVSWLKPDRLPGGKLRDGKQLTPDMVRYLLHRQSRVKEMRADLEARPLFQQVDRAACAELGLAVAQAYFDSKVSADDRWAMAFASLVGDDRLVPVYTRQIREWADGSRGKLAEYAVQALALLGTDAALLAVDALAIRYRSKNKNIGKAATEAFGDAARARGLTVEELGDLVIPWLGFPPGQPRVVEAGKSRIAVRISDDFKLTFQDAATGRAVTKLPSGAPAAAKEEFKGIAASLKEAAKSQLLRLETLMVRQFRWPSARWRELFLVHPLLLPFAHRLVWGVYEAANPRVVNRTFRVLDDLSLTDAEDGAVVFPSKGAWNVGVVHPLELPPPARQAWLRHLADYEVIPPFPQLDRPVVMPRPEEVDLRFGAMVANTEINGMTFKGRAERLGWTRGSVCDAGAIAYYLKSFPSAGVDVFVGTNGMHVGMDMETGITLGQAFFVKHGSVRVAAYEYDEPGDAADPRLVRFGDVPAIAFSEAMGDLRKIAGKAEAATAEGEVAA